MVGILTVEDVVGGTADGAAENLRVRIHGQRVGLLRFQRPRGGHEQRGRTDARSDVPGIAFASHPAHSTPPGGEPFSAGAQREWRRWAHVAARAGQPGSRGTGPARTATRTAFPESLAH